MDRRDFIKNTGICSGTLCLCGGLYNMLFRQTQSILNDTQRLKLLEKTYEHPITQPVDVILESCTLCELSCPGCWRNLNPDRFPLGYLTFNNFKKFINKNPFVKHINLAYMGEMFLNPDLNKIIEYAYKKGVLLSAMCVNLNTLTEKTAELMVKKKFGIVTVSIDGASPKTYSIYRRGGDFNKVIDNIKKIQFYKKKYQSDFPHIYYKFVVFGHNEHEIPKAKELAKQLGIPIYFEMNYLAGTYSPVKNIEYVKSQTGVDYSNPENNWNFSTYRKKYNDYKRNNNEWFYCLDIVRCPVIFYDGKFMGCCMVSYDKTPNLNAFETSLEELLKSPEIKKISNIIALKESDPVGTICQGCDVLDFLKKYNYKVSI